MRPIPYPYPLKTSLATIGIAAALGLMGCAAQEDHEPDPPVLDQSWSYDVVVVLLDAAAAPHLQIHGYDRPTTPRILELATESVVFERAYAQASGTALSVYSLFTSRYPVFEKVPSLVGQNIVYLEEDAVTLAEALAPRYAARLMLSTNPFVTEHLGYLQGATHAVEDWRPTFEEKRAQPPLYAERVTGPFLDWVDTAASDPYFAYLHYIEPHAPYLPPDAFRRKLARGESRPVRGTMNFLRQLGQRRPPDRVCDNIVDLYDGNLAYVDSHVGALVDSLRARDRWDRTVLVLLSDHGEGFWQHGTKGHGGVPYEEVVHVPLLLRIPGVEARRVSDPVELVDLLPTLLELAGIPDEDPERVGRSLLPLALGQTQATENRVIHMRSNRTKAPVYALREGRYKWLLFVNERRHELYDLQTDPGEKEDLVAAGRAPRRIMDRFEAVFAEWLRSGEAQRSGSIDESALNEEMIESLRSLGYVE